LFIDIKTDKAEHCSFCDIVIHTRSFSPKGEKIQIFIYVEPEHCRIIFGKLNGFYSNFDKIS